MKTLVILHGWGHNSKYWDVMKGMYEIDFNVAFFDMPGFGSEPLISQDWGVPEYAEWVLKKIEIIEGEKIIIGHSFGGRIATYIASSRPKWLKALILSGSPSIYRPGLKIKTKIFLAKLAKTLGLRKFFIKNSGLQTANRNNMGRIFRKVVPFDQTQILSKISVPTLLIWGENDQDVPLRIAKEINSHISGSQLKVIDRVGHNSFIENPYLFYGISKKFIESI